jgi:hypothetical protein
MLNLVSQLKEPTFTEPAIPMKEDEKIKWSKDYDLFLKKKDRYEDQRAKVFMIILGQCDEPMKSRVESSSGYDKMEALGHSSLWPNGLLRAMFR